MNKISNYIKDLIAEIKVLPLHLKPVAVAGLVFEMLLIPYIITLATKVYIDAITIPIVVSFITACVSLIAAFIIELCTGRKTFLK